MLATWHFHIEISSKCTLRCPRCARQEVPDTLVNTELDLAFFKRNFTKQFILDNLEKITFCGDDGDPIYAHDLVPVIQYIKSVKPVQIVIITNGSHRRTEWWEQLGRALDHNDAVHFSIDGWDNESNNQYRVNSDFDSIINGIRTLRRVSACELVWAMIAFNFNQTEINRMQLMALDLGMDKFQLTKSTKFGSIYPVYGPTDNLEPNTAFVSTSHRFERTIIPLWTRSSIKTDPSAKLFEQTKDYNGVRPLCQIGNKGLYIDAQGRLFPCCWVANRYSHNTEWQTLAKQFSLHDRTLAQVLEDPFWRTEMQTYRWQECQTKCATSRVNQEYATTW